MLPAFSAQINYKSDEKSSLDGVKNFVEGYCSILTDVVYSDVLGRSVKHYQQIDSKNAVPVSNPQSSWKQTVAKIIVIGSLLIPVIPLLMFAAKWINRKINVLHIQPPAFQNPDNHCYLEKAREIRNFRVNPAYVSPQENKKMAFHFRNDLPADLIINSLFKDEVVEDKVVEKKVWNPFMMCDHFPWQKHLRDLHCLNESAKAKQDKILEEGFNGFRSVQGLEDMKGGIRNLLNIMVEGVVRTPYAGGLIKGDSSYCAGPHGPFYVILKPSFLPGNMVWDEDAQIAYLVPEQQHREFLEKALNEAEQRGYITEGEKIKALKKVITYDEFIALPEKERHSEQALKRWLGQKN